MEQAVATHCSSLFVFARLCASKRDAQNMLLIICLFEMIVVNQKPIVYTGSPLAFNAQSSIPRCIPRIFFRGFLEISSQLKSFAWKESFSGLARSG